MSRLQVTPTPLPGLCLVARARLADERGHLSRLFCAAELASFGWTQPIAQINHTHTRHCGTVRGLHYQRPPHAEAKLVSCLKGEVWDLAVDLRPASPTYLQWHAQRLSPDNGLALLIPPGLPFALPIPVREFPPMSCPIFWNLISPPRKMVQGWAC